MANILVNFEKGIEVAATDVLKFITQSQSLMTKVEPGVVAAMGVLFGAAATALASVSAAAAAPMNLELDIQTVTDLRAVWPDVVSFTKALGINL